MLCRCDNGVEEGGLLAQGSRVLLTLAGSLGGVSLVGRDQVGRGATRLLLHDVDDDVAEAEAAAGNALLKNPGPRLLIGLDLVAVAHLLDQIHHGTELALVLDRGGVLGLAFEDLLQSRVVGGDIRRAVGDVHLDEDLAGGIIVLHLLDLLDPGSGVGVDFVAEKIVLLRRTEAGANSGDSNGGGAATHD